MSRRSGRSIGDRWPHIVLLDPLVPGLALARTMARLGASVSAIEDKPFAGGSRYVAGVVAPYQPRGDDWLQALAALAARHEEVVVLTGSDRASELLAGPVELPGNARAFEAAGAGHLALMDKVRAGRIAEQAGVLTPWSRSVSREDELAALLGEAPWPCVVKPTLSHEWRERFGEERVFLVEDAESASRALRPALRAGLSMLLCQYVPGADSDVEEAIVVRLADGRYPVAFGCRKLRQYPPGFGSTAVGESAPLIETMALARRILDEAGFVGVAGVEAKRDRRTGERWFLEVNVRLPAQWGLGDACGANASPRVVAALAGRELGPAIPGRYGVRFVRAELDWHGVAATLSGAPARELPAVAWRALRPYLGARELGVLDLRDPWPVVRLAVAFVGRRLLRLWRRFGAP